MLIDWGIALSSAGGVLVTLSGVFAGAVLANRAQKRHWARDKQIDVCAAVVAESTRLQIAIRRAWKNSDPVDWAPWNIALGTLSLVGEQEMVAAAARMDEVFWTHGKQFIRGDATDEPTWWRVRDLMESARLDFINVARTHVTEARTPMTQIPVSRPPLPPALTVPPPEANE